jgi:glucan phosphorylase
VAASGLFTTHTPVPAGIDTFSPDQMDRYFGSYREAFGLSREEFLDARARAARPPPTRPSTWRCSPSARRAPSTA